MRKQVTTGLRTSSSFSRSLSTSTWTNLGTTWKAKTTWLTAEVTRSHLRFRKILRPQSYTIFSDGFMMEEYHWNTVKTTIFSLSWEMDQWTSWLWFWKPAGEPISYHDGDSHGTLSPIPSDAASFGKCLRHHIENNLACILDLVGGLNPSEKY